MRIGDVQQALVELVAKHGDAARTPPTATALIDLVVDWYATVRVDGVDLDADGDMLLFQWGTRDDSTRGSTFQVDITRQLIDADDRNDEDDEAIWQLSSTLHYPAGPDSMAKAAGDLWCESPADIDDFTASIDGTDVAAFLRTSTASRLEITLDQA